MSIFHIVISHHTVQNQNQSKTMLFHTNTEVFAYNSIKTAMKS